MKLYLACALLTLVVISHVDSARIRRSKEGDNFKVLLNLYKMNPLKESKIFKNFSNKILDPSKNHNYYKRYDSYENIKNNNSEEKKSFKQLKVIEDTIHQETPHYKKVMNPPDYKVSYKSEDFIKYSEIYDDKIGKETLDFNKSSEQDHSIPKVQDIMPDFDKMFESKEDELKYGEILGNTLNNLDTHEPNLNYVMITNKEKLFDPDRHKLLLAQENLLDNYKSQNHDQNLAAIYKKSSKAWSDLIIGHKNDKISLAHENQYKPQKISQMHENTDFYQNPSTSPELGRNVKIHSDFEDLIKNNDKQQYNDQNLLDAKQKQDLEQNQLTEMNSNNNKAIYNDEQNIPETQNTGNTEMEINQIESNQTISEDVKRFENPTTITIETQAPESDFVDLLKPKDSTQGLNSNNISSAISNKSKDQNNIEANQIDVTEEDAVINL